MAVEWPRIVEDFVKEIEMRPSFNKVVEDLAQLAIDVRVKETAQDPFPASRRQIKAIDSVLRALEDSWQEFYRKLKEARKKLGKSREKEYWVEIPDKVAGDLGLWNPRKNHYGFSFWISSNHPNCAKVFIDSAKGEVLSLRIPFKKLPKNPKKLYSYLKKRIKKAL